MNYRLLKKVTIRRIKFLLNPIKDYLFIKDINIRTKYARYYKNLKLKDNYVLYETRDGKSMTDNPYAIFKYLLNNEKFSNLIHVWSLADKNYLKEMKLQYKQYKNVKFVLRNSSKYWKYLATCKYLINNSTFPNLYTVKDEQVYINTWHGTPLKHMGFDIPGQPLASGNVLRNFLSARYILSPNRHTTNIFNKSFKLENVYNGTILEKGYPRIDLTINADKKEVKNLLNMQGINVGNKKIILYAPTWKGSKVSSPRNDVDQIINDIEKIENKCGDQYTVLVKVHPFLYNVAKENPLFHGKLIPDTFDTNELLSITDLLITDYSSIFFDFLITKRPILFYMWDYQDYKENRGMYIDIKELPGPVSTDIDTLLNHICNIDTIFKDYHDKYNSFVEKFCNHEDGRVTEKIVNIIFNQSELNNETENDQKRKKEKILIYPGGLKNNGITGALLNLLENIDYDRYDVSLLVSYTNNQEAISNMLKINPNVRLIFKIGRISNTFLEKYKNYLVVNRGISSKFLESIYPTDMYKREFKRICGISTFDYVIDYSGYSMFWPNLLLTADAKKKMIFMHSDLFADMNKRINGVRPHFINLRGVFTLYKYFDELVSVSEATMNVNKEKLKQYIGNTKISFVNNCISPKKIKQMANDKNELYYKEDKPVLINAVNNKGVIKIENIPFPVKDDDYINFVNMGRLSPEKGQDQLIEAFALLHKEFPNTRLYIIGDGVLKEKLKNIIQDRSVTDSVFLMGHRENPFFIMNNCDAFVLSSHYEGQPMVLLEALTLGLQIVATDIIANRHLLENGKYGILVENSVEGIYKGMKSIVEKQSINAKFDAEEYNRKAIESFYEKLKVN